MSLCAAGCGREPQRGVTRVETVPVTGIVLVDGQPANNLRVSAVHSTATQGLVPHSPGGYTKEDGRFSLSTYESGDGVPPGDYKLTFVWGEINLMNGQYSGDKLKGKYAEPLRSAHPLQLSSGDNAVDMGTIELKSR
ncbi:MAG: hypothetical protein KDA91_02505 [Planctomycetaceae bacterium]|nr:hypothetical protein [Planctomycetaceae bacterium]